ncbi:Clavaminate synthase-like protein [Aspergillus homomorphus CBS 101889]|uniref:Clavaminate synthase-like protein n=1 Tax=Aspergillus homomorphus (strain CBS 101889) TaxID=1450537 RepID=A0A395HJD8_ASPHC|nr:Clavaminate synthase-like protein [Aspergillus homomorphus CBS 101889]RAL08031.1 Clavaminate synthase-like protein [Aspergillus homomorphus CBS 101889]
MPWAELVTLDLSRYDQAGDKEELVKQLDHAVRHVGFFHVKDFNISQEEISPICSRSTDLESGEYDGYRPAAPGLGNGIKGNIQVYNIPKFDGYHKRKQPPVLADHIDEIESSFSRKCHSEVVVKLLRLFAILLELPDEDNSPTTTNTTDEENTKVASIYTPGHTDLGTVTLLFRQPVAALQILNSEGEWKWVRPQDSTITINTCDALTALTGRLIKSSFHRVHASPPVQAHVDWLGVLYSARPNNHVLLNPITNSPLLNRLGLTQNVRQTQQQRRNRDVKVSNDGKFSYGEMKSEVLPGLEVKVYN